MNERNNANLNNHHRGILIVSNPDESILELLKNAFGEKVMIPCEESSELNHQCCNHSLENESSHKPHFPKSKIVDALCRRNNISIEEEDDEIQEDIDEDDINENDEDDEDDIDIDMAELIKFIVSQHDDIKNYTKKRIRKLRKTIRRYDSGLFNHINNFYGEIGTLNEKYDTIIEILGKILNKLSLVDYRLSSMNCIHDTNNDNSNVSNPEVSEEKETKTSSKKSSKKKTINHRE
jgi:hypothetical protein